MKKTIFAAMLCFIFLNGYHTIGLAEEKETGKIEESKRNQEQKSREGLMGYFFETEEFTKPVLIGPTSKSGLTYGQENAGTLIDDDPSYGSFRWLGYIVSQETKDATLSLSGIEDFKIEVEGKNISDPQNKQRIHLEKDRPISIKIEAISNGEMMDNDIGAIQLFSESESGRKEIIGMDQLRNPEFGEKADQEVIRSASRSSLYNNKASYDETKDTDGDNIPDLWEVNGYTIQNKLAVKWTEELENAGYTKFTSNPLQAHTVGDPYTDYEKAAKDMPLSNSEETLNPLVAAYPSVNVNLEKIILSKNVDLSNSVSSNHSTNWTQSNTEGVDVTVGWAGLGPNFGVTGHYTHSDTVANEWGGSNDDTEHINNAESAYLNANVRYNNVGTGSIHEVKPTVSFVLGNTTVGTITAQSNSKALSIAPDESYPRKGQNGIAINTMDDFDSRPIPLNRNQLTEFMSNKSPMLLETNQVDGQYMIKNMHGQIVLGGSWNGVQQEINKKTASIIIDDGDSMAERKIAAKNYSDPEDKTPELTFKEALKLGFKDITEKNGEILYKGKSIEEYHSLIFVDAHTADKVNKQLENAVDVKDFYDIKLEHGMAITIKQSSFYDGAKTNVSPLGTFNDTVTHRQQDDTNSSNGVYYAKSSTTPGNWKTARLNFSDTVTKQLNPNSKYYITLSVKADSRFPTSMITLRTLNEDGFMIGTNKRFQVSSDGYQRVTIVYNPDNSEDDLSTFELVFVTFGGGGTLENQAVYFKDISITEMGTWIK